MLGKAPNITGSLASAYEASDYAGATDNFKGAFYLGLEKDAWGANGDRNNAIIYFNAQSSNSMYKTSTVQTPSLKVIFLIKS